MNAASKYFNKTDEELTALLYEDDGDGNLKLRENAADVLIGLDAKRIERIKDEASKGATEKFDQGYQKAQKDVLSKFEKDLRDKYGVESNKTGIDLIDDIIGTASKGGEITEDTLKTHPLFLRLENETKKEYDARIKEVKEEFDSYKENVEREKSMSAVKNKARAAFLSLNPVLSEDKAKAENQIAMFLEGLKPFGYIPDNDTFIITENDKRKEDGHGNPLSFDNFIKQQAEKTFDFKVQDRRQSPGNMPGTGVIKTKVTKKEYSELVARYEREGDYESMSKLKDYEIID